jgi:hypothetical protein
VPHPQDLQLQASPTVFSLTDTRLFHHFLGTAYPQLPLGNDKVWVTDIASLSHSVGSRSPIQLAWTHINRYQYGFLAHAVLGIAASHLNGFSSSQLHSEALSHRLLAIKGLNEALSTPPKSSADADAMLATCYALATQSTFMHDSIREFFTMLRGAQLIMAQQWPKKLGTVFQSLDSHEQLQVACSRLKVPRVIDTELIEEAKGSLMQIWPLCTTDAHRMVLQAALDVIHALNISSQKGLHLTLSSSIIN